LEGAALENMRGGPLIAYHEGESVRGPEDWVYREGENFALGALEVPTYWYGEFRRNPERTK
jgi:hypothetical protein